MSESAFTVLPPLSPRVPPPPTTPAVTRVAPRAVAHKETSAFVILGEIKVGDVVTAHPGGRVSPFRGSGFRAPSPPSSRIPVPAGKSAPASPVRAKTSPTHLTSRTRPPISSNKAAPVHGKSAPTTPKKTNKTNEKPSKRAESPSKVPVSTKISVGAPKTKELTNNKRLSARPPVPKSPRRPTATVPATKSVPQPAKRSADGKPAPAARTQRLNNNKPVSTDVKAGSVGRDRFSTNNPPTAAVRRNLPAEEEKTKKSSRDTKAKEPSKNQRNNDDDNNNNTNNNSNNSNTKREEEKMNLKNSNELAKVAAKVEGNDVVNQVVTVTNAVPEVHKLEVIPAGHAEDQEEEDSGIRVVELITPDEDGTLKHVIVNGNQNEIVVVVDKAPPSPQPASEPNGNLPVEVRTVVEGSRSKVERIRNGMSALRAVRGSSMSSSFSSNSGRPKVLTRDEVVEETEATVEGLADVELEGGNHTVTFSSPEIHPVSPRAGSKKKKLSLRDRFRDQVCGCARGGSAKVGVAGSKPPPQPPAKQTQKSMEGTQQKWYSKLCRWRKEPPPPRLAKPMKAKGETFLSKLNCCKRKGKMTTRKPPPAPTSPSCWRKLFCLDRACCAKLCCKKTPPAAAIPPVGASRLEMKRSSSVAVPPKPTGLPKLDAVLVEHASVMKGAIPALPICLAWMCLILNIVLPGTGTIISGFLCLCFGKPRFSVNDSGVARLGSLCVNLIVGISQIFTILFCLVGWGWSIWWGVIMVKIARKSRRIKLAEQATLAVEGLTSNAPAAANEDVEKGGGGNR